MSTHPIPNAALDEKLAFLGISGSGKTYNAGVAVERLLDQKARVCIIDPLGAWWGLRLKANGKQPSGYNILIFGGPHGDYALTENSGALLGETVAGMSESCILDLSEVGSDAAERRFMLAFFNALYKHQSKSLLHLIVDEADMWAPQQIFDKEGGAAQLVGKMQNIVRRGRLKGFIPWLITQRPAVLNWGVLSQITGIVAFTLTASQDRDAIGNWVKGEANKDLWKQIWDQLPELAVGSGLVWVPRRKVFGIKAFPAKTTFDSSRAPKRGERRATRKLKPLNVDKLKERFAEIEAQAKANDPTKLKSEIAGLRNEKLRLEQQLAKAPVAKPGKDVVAAAETRGIDKGQKAAVAAAEKNIKLLRTALEAAMKFIVEINAKGFFKAGGEAVDKKAVEKAIGSATGHITLLIEQHLGRRNKQIDALSAQAEQVIKRLNAVLDQDVTLKVDVAHSEPFTIAATTNGRATRPAAPSRVTTPAGDGELNLTGTKQAILDAIAWTELLGAGAASKMMVAFLADSSPKSSTFEKYVSQLRSAGLIVSPRAGEFALTDEGRACANQQQTPPDHHAMMASISRKLTDGQLRIVKGTTAAYPNEISKDELAAAAGMSPSSSTFEKYVSQMRSLGLIESPVPKMFKASDRLFPERLAA